MRNDWIYSFYFGPLISLHGDRVDVINAVKIQFLLPFRIHARDMNIENKKNNNYQSIKDY
jgi:hypothetical protein